MSALTARSTMVRRERAGRLPKEDCAPTVTYRAKRPPESELASSRGLMFAVILVMPFWLVLGAFAALA